jgi:galactose mutarotase-like enzyme
MIGAFATRFQQHENEGSAMSSKTIRLTGPGLAAEISELGAELVRLQDREGRDLLWSGDPAVWAGRAPLLFPMVGRAKDDRIRVDGRDYELPKHGFARTSRFSVVERREDSCTLRLASGPETLIGYPFAFRLDVTYEIAGPVLINRAVVTNQDERALPLSFGFHPAFCWPLPYGADRAAHAIVFEQDESSQPIRRVQDGLMTPVRHPTPVAGNRLTLADDLFVDDALIFLSPASRSVTYGVTGRPALAVRFPGMPHLGIWTKPGSGYVCIEPWQGYASPDDFDGEFAERPGVISVPVGGAATFAIEIALLPEMPQ